MTIDINGELNATDKLFIAAYIRNKCNGTKAWKEVSEDKNVSDNVAAAMASERLRKIKVRNAVDKKLEDIAAVAEVDAVWTLKNRMKMVERCMQAEPVMEFDKEEKRMVPTGEYKFDSSGANAALTAIEKIHLGIAEKQQVDTSLTVIVKNYKDIGKNAD